MEERRWRREKQEGSGEDRDETGERGQRRSEREERREARQGKHVDCWALPPARSDAEGALHVSVGGGARARGIANMNVATRSAAWNTRLSVGTSKHHPPRHSTHSKPSFLYYNGIR